jgi:hypothetical protein
MQQSSKVYKEFLTSAADVDVDTDAAVTLNAWIRSVAGFC